MGDHLDFAVEQLEDRQMLAVVISFNENSGLLRIRGDSESDVVQLDGSGVAGTAMAYVNGTDAGTFVGVHRISASLGSGDDTFNVGAISIGGTLKVNMGSGADFFSTSVFVAEPTNSPNGDVFIGGAVSVNMGNNANDIIVMNSFNSDFGQTFGNNVTLTGATRIGMLAGGTSYAIDQADINILGNLSIRLSNTSAGLVQLQDVNVGGTTRIRGSKFEDSVTIGDSAFARRVMVDLGGGDDFLDLGDGSEPANWFGHKATFKGGAGTDTLDNRGMNVFAFSPTIDFEFLV